MEHSAELRIGRLEARVAALETRLDRLAGPALGPGAAAVAPAPVPLPATDLPPAPPPVAVLPPPKAPAPAAVPAPQPARVVPDTPPPSRPRFDFERFFGLAVLGRIGVGAVLLAAAYFGQLGWGQLPPALRVLAIYLAAGAMVTAGALLERRAAPKYVAMLYGGGVAVSYLAGVVGRLHYGLIPGSVALPLLVGSTALGQFLARRLRLQGMAVLALAGAYAAPVLVGVDTGSPTAFFVYLLALHAWAAWTERRWQWLAARRLAVAATLLLAGGWLLQHPPLPPLSHVLHVEAVLLLLVWPELTDALGRRPQERAAALAARWPLVLAGAGAVQPLLIAWTWWHNALPGFALAAGLAWLALAAVGTVAGRGAERPEARHLAQLGGVLATLGAFLACGHPDLAAAVANGCDRPLLRVGAAVAAALLLLAARKQLGAADLALGLAGGLGLAAVQLSPALAEGRALAAIAALAPIALVALGSTPNARTAGLALGAALAFAAVRLRDTLEPPLQWWLPIAATAAVAWVAAAAWLRRGDDVVARAASRGLVLLWLPVVMALVPGLLPVLFDTDLAAPRLPVATLPAAAAALGAAALLWHGGRELRARAALAGNLGGALFAAAAFALSWPTGAEHPWLPLCLATGVAALLLALRRFTGAGELGAAVGALLAASVVVLPPPDTTSRLQTGVAILAAAALVLFGRPAAVRCGALVLGTAVLFFGTSHALTFAEPDGAWTSLAIALAAGGAALGALGASVRRDRALLATAAALLAVLGVVWSVLALAPAEAATPALPAFVNVRFLAAIAVTALLEFARRHLPPDIRPLERAVFVTQVLAVAWLAGLVELLAAVDGWPVGWSDVTISLYTLLFAAALLVAGFVRRQPWLRWTGLAGFAIVVVKVSVFDLRALATPLRVLVTGVLGLVLLLGAWGYARLRARPPDPPAG